MQPDFIVGLLGCGLLLTQHYVVAVSPAIATSNTQRP